MPCSDQEASHWISPPLYNFFNSKAVERSHNLYQQRMRWALWRLVAQGVAVVIVIGVYRGGYISRMRAELWDLYSCFKIFLRRGSETQGRAAAPSNEDHAPTLPHMQP